MDYSICVARPRGYVHSQAFAELAELVGHGLTDLGHRATLGINRIEPNTIPILIGIHLLNPDRIAQMPPETIVINTEQIHGAFEPWNRDILKWVKSFETWDYSARNVEALKRETARPVRLLRLGYHPALARIDSVAEPDIDVLFYGSISERRKALLDRLTADGVAVRSVFGIYGEERDKLIARSKIILNIHNHDTEIFEIVRCFYLMINRKAVVAEVNPGTAIDPAYRDGVAAAPCEEIFEVCLRLLGDDSGRRALEERAFATISLLPQAELLAPLVAR